MLKNIPPFTFDRIMRSIQYIDVIWFNKRSFPEKVFEIEDSTDFRSSLVKFTELQDFRTTFNLIAPPERKEKYHQEVTKSAFQGILDRCRFVGYNDIEKLYDARLNYHTINQEVFF